MSLTNTFVGYKAGADPSQSATVENSTALGANAYTTADNQVALGDDAVTHVRAAGTVMYRAVGSGTTAASAYFGDAGNAGAGNEASVAVGPGAMAAAVGTTNAVAIGNLALSSNTTSNGLTAVGSRAMRDSIDCIDTTMVGNRAGACMTTGVGRPASASGSLSSPRPRATRRAWGTAPCGCTRAPARRPWAIASPNTSPAATRASTSAVPPA